jgi:MFS transporter, DHA1 family, multidrug resistance protein
VIRPRRLAKSSDKPDHAAAGPGPDDASGGGPRRRGPLRGLPPEVGALVGVAFMVALGFGVVAPTIPLFARQFGVSRTAASAVISAFALMRLLTAPFVGRLVNALGERVLLATGIAVVAVSSLLAGLAQSYWQLLVLRGAGGVGSIMFSVSAASLLIRVTPGHQRGRAQGAFTGAFLVGAIAGPAVGTVASWSLRAPFFLYAVTLGGAGAIGLRALRTSPLAAPPTRRDSALALRAALRNRAYLAALAAELAESWAVVGVRSAMVPLFVVDQLGLSPSWTYLGFLSLSVVSGALLLPLGRIADSRGRRPILLAGLAVAVAGLATLPLLPSRFGLFLAMVLLGCGGAALAVAPGAIVGDVVAGRGGTVVAAFQMAGDVGSVTGPVVAGWLADAHGYAAAFLVAAAVAALPIGVVARAPETLRRPD